jgi:hypothetical protein
LIEGGTACSPGGPGVGCRSTAECSWLGANYVCARVPFCTGNGADGTANAAICVVTGPGQCP